MGRAAQPITLPADGTWQTFRGADLDTSSDLDYFAFTIEGPGTVVLDTDARESNFSSVDTILTLFGPDGVTVLNRNDDGIDPQTGFRGLNSALTSRLEQAGTYFALVSAFGSTSGAY